MNKRPPAPISAITGRPSAVTGKWGVAADAGFQMVPDVLLKSQAVLGLSATELVVLLNLMMHWWYPEQKPFPRATTIAERMSIEVRSVQRAMARLRELGLIKREKIATEAGERTVIDLGGLVARLGELAVCDVAYRPRLAASAEGMEATA
jgi:hypothetical protein